MKTVVPVAESVVCMAVHSSVQTELGEPMAPQTKLNKRVVNLIYAEELKKKQKWLRTLVLS